MGWIKRKGPEGDAAAQQKYERGLRERAIRSWNERHTRSGRTSSGPAGHAYVVGYTRELALKDFRQIERTPTVDHAEAYLRRTSPDWREYILPRAGEAPHSNRGDFEEGRQRAEEAIEEEKRSGSRGRGR